MIRSIVLPAAAALSVVAIGGPAFAQEETETRHVSYADLNLSAPAGRAALTRRVANAVEEVCGEVMYRNLHSGMAVAACRSEAWEMVQPQLNAALGANVEVLAANRIRVERRRRVRG